jgi:hypothetical protein
MKFKLIFPLILFILILSKTSIAQTRDTLAKKDSLTKRIIAYTANKFPSTRTFNLEFSGAAPYNFTSTLGGDALPPGRVTNWTQLRASANINFIQTKKWVIGATFNYRMTSVTAALDQPVAGLTSSVNETFRYHATSLNLMRVTKLFNKTTIINGSASIDGSEKQFERVRGLIATTMLLKADAKTRLGVGLMVNFDPGSILPVLPIFSYEHRFDNGLIADITLPRNIYIRKHVLKNGRLSIGTELDRTGFYLYNQDNTGRTFEFNQIDLNSGLTYEHLIFNNFIVTLKGGLRSSLSPMIFDRQKTRRDPIFETKPDATGYFNVGISYNPFAPKRR